MKQSLGEGEARFFAYVQMRGIRTVRIGDIAPVLGLTQSQEYDLLRRLAAGGLIARVRPGLYLVPEKLPVGGSWVPDEILALNTLIEDRAGRYQVCGPSAFNRYGFDEQIPARTYAYNNRISGTRGVGSLRFTLIKVADARLGGVERIKRDDGTVAFYSSRARSLIDAVYDWSRFNGLPRAFSWIRRELAAERVSVDEIVKLAIRFGDVGTKRRIGVLLEKEGADERTLKRLARGLRPSTAAIPWNPAAPKRGRLMTRWCVIDNWEERDAD